MGHRQPPKSEWSLVLHHESAQNTKWGSGSRSSSKLLNVMRHRDQSGLNEEEFLAFAKSYLSEASPNPQRIDCPPHSDLTGWPNVPGRPQSCKTSQTVSFRASVHNTSRNTLIYVCGGRPAPNDFFRRASISAGVRSSRCVAIAQTKPNGSLTSP